MLFFFPFILVAITYGQSTEYSMQANTGYFYFSDGSPTILLGLWGRKSYIHNPYGSGFALSYGVATQIQRITKKQIVLGFQLGTELLRSRVQVNEMGAVGVGLAGPAKGHGILSMGFINLFPNIGRRFLLHSSVIDLTVGPEIGFIINSWERGIAKVKSPNFTYTTDYKIRESNIVLNIRSKLTEYWGKWGVSVGYSYGLHGYYKTTYRYDSERHFSHFITVGLVCKIK